MELGRLYLAAPPVHSRPSAEIGQRVFELGSGRREQVEFAGAGSCNRQTHFPAHFAADPSGGRFRGASILFFLSAKTLISGNPGTILSDLATFLRFIGPPIREPSPINQKIESQRRRRRAFERLDSITKPLLVSIV